MRSLLFSIVLIGFITLYGCGIFKEPSFREMQNLKVEKLGVSSSVVRMELLYENPNPIGFQVLSSSFDLYIDDVFLGHAGSDSLIQVPKKSSFVLPVVLKADMKNLFRNTWAMMTNASVLVKAKGTVTVKAGGIRKTMPLDYEGRHEMRLF